MQNRIILKPVGANCIRQNSNGITLIALIITIIVMVMLVGVTVNVALNGGLFETAKNAANSTQIEADREILQAGVVSAMASESGITQQSLLDNLPTGWNVAGSEGGPYTATSPNQKMFKVLSDGTIKEPSTGDLALLEEYFLGKVVTEILNSDYDNTNYTDSFNFINNSVIPNAEEDLVLLNTTEGVTEVFLYAKYNDKAYEISVDSETFICNNVELIYEPSGREGEIVTYDSDNDGTEEEWIILYDNGDNIEMVSMNFMGSLVLGYADESASNLEEDLDENGQIDSIDKAIYSYNNAITRLNNYCASLVTNENKISVRSAGTNPNDPSNENTILYESENLANWAEGKYNKLLKSGDINCEQDLIRMSYYETFNPDLSLDYWLASRYIRYNKSGDIEFCIVELDKQGFMMNGSNNIMISVNSSKVSTGYHDACVVLPIIKISSDAI